MSTSKSESGCKFGNQCSFPHRKVEEQPNKKPKKGGDKSAVAILKDVRQLGCVFQETEPPESDFLGRAQKFWDQFDEYDPQKLCSVTQTSEKTKDHRSVKYKSKFPISAVLTL